MNDNVANQQPQQSAREARSIVLDELHRLEKTYHRAHVLFEELSNGVQTSTAYLDHIRGVYQEVKSLITDEFTTLHVPEVSELSRNFLPELDQLIDLLKADLKIK